VLENVHYRMTSTEDQMIVPWVDEHMYNKHSF